VTSQAPVCASNASRAAAPCTVHSGRRSNAASCTVLNPSPVHCIRGVVNSSTRRQAVASGRCSPPGPTCSVCAPERDSIIWTSRFCLSSVRCRSVNALLWRPAALHPNPLLVLHVTLVQHARTRVLLGRLASLRRVSDLLVH
jgi:hypothetical protein